MVGNTRPLKFALDILRSSFLVSLFHRKANVPILRRLKRFSQCEHQRVLPKSDRLLVLHTGFKSIVKAWLGTLPFSISCRWLGQSFYGQQQQRMSFSG